MCHSIIQVSITIDHMIISIMIITITTMIIVATFGDLGDGEETAVTTPYSIVQYVVYSI